MENKNLLIVGVALAVVIVLGAVLILGGGSQTPVDGKALKEKFDAAVEKAAQMKKNGCQISEAERLLQETRNAYVQGDLSSATAILAQAEEALRTVSCPGIPPVKPPANKTNHTQAWNGSIKTNSDTVGRYEKFEISFNPKKTYSNPFDPEVISAEVHFTSPSGKEEIAIGFWYQDYTCQMKPFTNPDRPDKQAMREVCEPSGEPFWMFRYAPVETGEYKYYITIEEGGSASAYRYPENGQLKFSATASGANGYIGVGKKSPRYFEFSEGETFFGIGTGPHDVFESLAKNIETHKSYEMNMIQCEFEAPFGMEHETLGEYDLEMAYRGDLAMEKAEEQEVYMQMVLTHFSNWVDVYELPPADSLQEFEERLFQMWRDSPYNSKNGGPIAYPLQYFTNEEAKKYAKNRMRYYVARWGYSTNVMSWQFWGEMDNVVNLASEEGKKYFSQKAMTDWLSEMSAYVKSLDGRHLVSANLNYDYDPSDPNTKWKDDMWRIPEIDYITAHNYADRNEFSLANEIENYYYNFGKPMVVQEYPCSDDMEVSQHNIIWRLSLNGLAATPMRFSYNDRHDEYTVFGDFIRGLDVVDYETGLAEIEDMTPKGNIVPLTVEKKDGSIRTIREGGYISPVKIYGISNQKQAHIWIQDLLHNSLETAGNAREGTTGYIPTLMENVKFRLSGMENGDYLVEFFDTWEGRVISNAQASASGGTLTIEVPDFKKDIAVRITKKS